MSWFLVIMFSINGGFEIREGWYPLVQTDMQTCLESSIRVQTYFEATGLKALVYCELKKETD